MDEGRLNGIADELAAYERRYGVASSHLAMAFTRRGKLVETEDYRRWRFLYTVWQRVNPAITR